MRRLFQTEIDDILSCIQINPFLPELVGQQLVDKIKNQLSCQLQKEQIYPEMIDALKQRLKLIYSTSQIQPGESVGILMAQSIGEKQTQANLNSVDYTEKLLIHQNNRCYVIAIGKLIDSMFGMYKSDIKIEGKHEYLSIKNQNVYIPSADKNGIVGWYKVDALTRHRVEDKLVKIRTYSGKTVIGTKDLSFVVWTGDKFTEKSGSELKIGDAVPATLNLPFPSNNNYISDELAYIMGLFLASGYREKDEIVLDIPNTVIYNKALYILDKLKGSCVQKGQTITITNIWINSIIINNCIVEGIKTVPFLAYNTNVVFIKNFLQGYESNYPSSDIHGINILRNLIKQDINTYGQTIKNDVYLDKIISIEQVYSTTSYVYDLEVDQVRWFQLYSGITVNDTFHKAGSSDKAPVVSKFSELLNVTNKPKAPCFYIYCKGDNNTIPKLRENIGHSLVQIDLVKISLRKEICQFKKPESWYDLYFLRHPDHKHGYQHCLSIDVDMKVLYEFKITLKQIAEIINKEYDDIFCMYSPDCFAKLNIYVDTDSVDVDEEKGYVTKENAIEIYLEEVFQPVMDCAIICGIPGVLNMFFLKDKGQWYIETENTRLKQRKIKKFKNTKEKQLTSVIRYQLTLGLPAIDATRTISNNVWDIYHTFGIEATRQYMIDQFTSIMPGINLCHVSLLVDKMTYSGSLSSISRYTMRKEDCGPLSQASFEETLDNFLNAGAFGQEEPTKGVSASVICGKKASIGTGMCDIVVDIDKLNL